MDVVRGAVESLRSLSSTRVDRGTTFAKLLTLVVVAVLLVAIDGNHALPVPPSNRSWRSAPTDTARAGQDVIARTRPLCRW
jgi:hypothetical protein